jgi:general secretion pathway protein C
MAPRAGTAGSEGGVALIAVDGKPARAFPVGKRVDGDLVLQSVSLRSAELGPGQGAASLRLELPALAAPATGTLPPPGGGAAPSGATTAGNVGAGQPGGIAPPAIPGTAPGIGAPGQRPGLGVTPPPGGAGQPPQAPTMQTEPAQAPPGVVPPPARESGAPVPGATSATTR